MHTNFDSFFTKQKQTKHLFVQYKKTDHVNQILSQYLFVENILQKSQAQFINSEQTIYSVYIQNSSLTNCIKCVTKFYSIKLDVFSYYLSIQLAFNVIYSAINSKPNDLTFFCYYNSAFVNNFATLKSINIVNNKSTRLNYQHNLQSIKQSTFLINGIQNSLAVFNNVFSKNNTDIVSLKKRHGNLFAKKFRSTKTIRNIILKTSITKRFNSQLEAKPFLKLYNIMYTRRGIQFYKSVSIFPQNIWYRNQIVKIRVRRNSIKFVSKKINISVFNTKKSGTYLKSLTPATFQFKLYPTEYVESTLNPSKFAQFKALSSIRLNARISFYQINALSLTRFAFDSEIKQQHSHAIAKTKLSKHYLTNIERERLSRYRSMGTYIKDLIRVCFFSIYLKKADFLATFFAFTISKLSRNQKELPFVRFLIKLLKIFASQNPDIIGVHIRFQGRLNRWRRTKHICGSKGKLTFSSYSTRVEYGIGQAITRKGTLGVHIWIAYQLSSSSKQAKYIQSYRGLPKITTNAK